MKQSEIIGIMITILAIGFIVYDKYASGNIHKKKVEDNLEPISQPVDTQVYESDNIIYWEWDSVMDSVEMDCGEYHGKEGKSEYGEYE